MIVVKYDPAGAIAQTAQNVGQFATDRALADESMRQKAFANDQSRQAAEFGLRGLGQAFNQRQQVDELNFHQQQADLQNRYHQEDAASQDAYRQQVLASQYDRANLANQGRLDVAGINGDNRLQGIYAQQAGANDRNDEDNQVKMLLQQNGQDWRTADHATVQAAREHIQQMRGQQGQDLEQLRFQNRGALQDDQQDFVGGQNDLNRQLVMQKQKDQQDFVAAQEQLKQNFQQDRDATKFQNDWAKLQEWKASRDAQAQQAAEQKSTSMHVQALRSELGNYQQLVTAYANARNRPMMQAAQQAYDRTLAELNGAMGRQMPPPLANVLPPMQGPPPNAPQLYGQSPQGNAPAPASAQPQPQQQFDPSSQMVDEQAVRQVIASVKAQMPGASREQIKAAVAQQLIASGIDPSFLQ